MGRSSYSTEAYTSFKSRSAHLDTDAIFTSNKTKTVNPKVEPKTINVRECRDSVNHPNSLAVKLYLDVTGSMGRIPEHLIKHKMGEILETLIKHNVVDPAILFGAIGDQRSDKAPIQVGQFESGTDELLESLSSIFIEGGGGGTKQESYLLAWYVAAHKTVIDCFSKRGKKGYLFTVGDEKSWDQIDSDTMKKIFGPGQYQDIYTDKELYEMASHKFNVFHIHIQSGSYPNDTEVFQYWKDIMGQNFIVLEDADLLAETVASAIAVKEGMGDEVLSAIGSSVVTNAVAKINSDIISTGDVIVF